MGRTEIETLGWLHDEAEPNNYVMGDLDLYHNPQTNFIKIDDADGETIYFQGTANNIAELKTIMLKLNLI